MAFRNSVSDEVIILDFSKLGVWSTGRWGKDPGNLINTTKLSFEIEAEEIQREALFQEVGENKEELSADENSFKDEKSFLSDKFFDAMSDIETFTKVDVERSAIQREIEKYFTTEKEESDSGKPKKKIILA